MRRIESFAAALARLCHPLAFSIALCLVLASSTFGQQQSQPKKRVPKLTTDDVARAKTTTVEVVSEAEAGAATAETKGEDTAKPAAARTGSDTKVDPDEASWRERLEKAKEHAKAAQRAADEGELRVSELRNRLGVSGGSARDRNDIAAELDQMGPRLRVLREEARTAEGELKEELEAGKKKSFTEAQGPKATVENGQPNDDYYKTKYAATTQEIEDAERKMQLYEIRLQDLNARMNSTSVDRFTASQLQQDRDEAQQKLEEAREVRAKAQTALDELKEQARRAGVAPGVFR